MSGLNAIAHAVEALYAQDADPIVQLMAEEGIGALYTRLPGTNGEPKDINARACASIRRLALRGRVSVALRWHLTTRSVTSWAVASISLMPRPTRSCCRMPSSLALRPRSLPSSGEIGRNAPATVLFELNAAFAAPTAPRKIGMPQDGIERAVRLALGGLHLEPTPGRRGRHTQSAHRRLEGYSFEPEALGVGYEASNPACVVKGPVARPLNVVWLPLGAGQSLLKSSDANLANTSCSAVLEPRERLP